MHASRRLGLVLVVLVLALLLMPGRARAHHVPGHGSSEGVRSINSLGGRGGAASSRLLLLNEFSHSGHGLVPGQANSLSLLGEYAPIRAFSFGVQLPFTVIAEQPVDGPDRVAAGYGDTRVFARVTPFARKLIHRTLTIGVAASFPTRTVRGSVDPGRTWSVTPSIIFTRTYERMFWQLLTFASTEWRPAGIALDLTAGGQFGGRLAKGKVALGVGSLLDVRTVNACRSVEGELAYCAGSRAGEKEREVGSIRATGLTTFAWNFHQAKNASWALNLGLQVPLSHKRDFDVGASAGLQVVF